MARKPLMAGNWKMNLNHLEAVAHVQRVAYGLKDEDYEACEVVVLTPFTDLRSVQVLIDADKYKARLRLAGHLRAREGRVHRRGVRTDALKLGGHLRGGRPLRAPAVPRRDQRIVNAKAKAALANGITPIICYGESLDVREAGDQVLFSLGQVEACLDGFSAEDASKVVLAYEPIWAIGTGLTASPTDAQEVCGATRSWLSDHYDSATADAIRILYGGSMKAANVASLMAQPDIDGGLIGGASLDPDEFVAMAKYRLLTP